MLCLQGSIEQPEPLEGQGGTLSLSKGQILDLLRWLTQWEHRQALAGE